MVELAPPLPDRATTGSPSTATPVTGALVDRTHKSVPKPTSIGSSTRQVISSSDARGAEPSDSAPAPTPARQLTASGSTAAPPLARGHRHRPSLTSSSIDEIRAKVRHARRMSQTVTPQGGAGVGGRGGVDVASRAGGMGRADGDEGASGALGLLLWGVERAGWAVAVGLAGSLL